jgi:hypothetical protein
MYLVGLRQVPGRRLAIDTPPPLVPPRLRRIARRHVLNRIPNCDDMHNVDDCERPCPTPMAPGHQSALPALGTGWMHLCRRHAAPLISRPSAL